MRWLPHGYGGTRRSPEDIKRDGWVEQGQVAPAPSAPAEVVAASVAAPPEKRGRGRPRKAR